MAIAKSQLIKCLEQYNEPISHLGNQNGNSQLNIVLFEYAIQHIARISRIFQKPGGHALLIGAGGIGRKVLTKLAAFINYCEFTEINKCKQYTRLQWEEDIKNVMRKTGIYQKKIVLYLRDSTLLQKTGSKTTSGSKASFLEDINSLLTSGDVPNLLSKAEKEDVLLQMRRSRPALRKSPNLMDLYIRQVSDNLKIVISVDPTGGLFGPALRQFPSLLTCTTCNWMSQLPIEAYQDVAQHFFGQIEGQMAHHQNQSISYASMTGGIGDEYVKSIQQKIQDNQMLLEKQSEISTLTVQFHAAACEQATKYKLETGRIIFVTLSNYLTLLEKIKYFHSKFKCEKQREILKYRAGVHKLDEANENVQIMHQEQQKLQPILEIKSKEVQITLAALGDKTKQQREVMQQVKQEEVEVSKRKQISQQIRDECQSRLNKALPELDAAIQALRTIKTQDFVTMRSYRSPPDLIKLTLDAVCILLGVKPDVSQKIIGRKKIKIYQYWQKAKRLLKDYKKLIDRLENFDRDNIPDDRIKKLGEYLDNPKFVPQIIRNASQAAQGLCKWARAIAAYDVIAKQIQPKREALKLANQKFKEVKDLFDLKEQELAQVQGKMNVLKQQFDKQNSEKLELMNKLDSCVKKKDRALKLLGGLNSEKSRWEISADQLELQLVNTLGDALLSASSVGYLGPYLQAYRVILKQEWINLLDAFGQQTGKEKITKSQKFCATKTLANPLLIQNWVLKGLPNEIQSIENIAFMRNSSKYPLIIDPQGQAARYIKQSDPKLHVLKLANGDYTFIQKAIINGWTVLIQDSLPDQDPSLQPLLTQSIQYKKKSSQDSKEEQNQVTEASQTAKKQPLSNELTLRQNYTPVIYQKQESMCFKKDQASQIKTTSRQSRQNPPGYDKQVEYRKIIRLNDQYLDWNPDFRLYMTCNSHNPKIPTHFFSNMLVINFTITASAIKQQLLSQVAWVQRQRDQEERIRILEQTTAFKQRKKDIQHEILSQLQRVGGAILQDDALITSLNYSKEVSQDLQNKLRSAKTVEDKLQVSRTELNPVANEATVFYFLVQDLICWSSAYRFSHQWFIQNLFVRALRGAGDTHKRVGGSVTGGGLIQNSASIAEQEKRNILLQKSVRKALFESMSMTLYSEHRLAFTLQMAIKLRQYQGQIDQDVIKFILSGIGKKDAPPLKPISQPKSKFINQIIWENIYQLEQISVNFPPLCGLRKNIINNIEKWQQFITSNELSVPFPAPYNDADPISLIALSKIFRQEDVPKYCKRLIQEVLGENFLSPHTSGLKEAAGISKSEHPILVLLPHHGGDDPLLQITKIAEQMNKKVMSMSLGKDSFKPAQSLLEQAFRSGRWLLLQNCHIASQVLQDIFTKFKILCDNGPDAAQPRSQLSYDFRLWLTVKPVENKIPQTVYMQCTKVCNDSPATINGILTKIYSSIKANKKQVQKFESSKRISQWRKLHMGLAFFHATLRLRQNYDTLGWSGFSKKQSSTLYDFNEDDFQSSKAILFEFLDNHNTMTRLGSQSSNKNQLNSKLSAPLSALSYITSKCIYGARIWQKNDQLLLQTLMKVFYNDAILNKSDYMFAGEFNDAYRVLATPYVYQVNAYLQSGMPRDQDPPMVLGLHPNADLISNVKLGHSVLKYTLQITSHSQKSRGAQFNNVFRNSTTITSESSDIAKTLSTAGIKFVVKAATRANFLLDTIKTVRQHIPRPLNFNKIKHNINAVGGMNELGIVAIAEVAKYNQLIRKMRQMIQDTDQCARGKYSGSVQTSIDKIECIQKGLTKFQVPLTWRKISYPTRKPLLSFLKGLEKRSKFFKNWGKSGVTPDILELPAFFHPPSLITRIKQLYARRNLTSYDQVMIGSSVLKIFSPIGKLDEENQQDLEMYQGTDDYSNESSQRGPKRKKSEMAIKKIQKQVLIHPNKEQQELIEEAQQEEQDRIQNQIVLQENQDENQEESISMSSFQKPKKLSLRNQSNPKQPSYKSQSGGDSEIILIHQPKSSQKKSSYQSQFSGQNRDDCVQISGILLQGAGWNVDNGYLIESNPRQLQFEMPVIRLEPEVILDIQDSRPAQVQSLSSHEIKLKHGGPGYKSARNAIKSESYDQYEITMYYTKDRSVRDCQVAQIRQNYILKMKIKCQGSRDNWIKRGVAFIAEYDV